MTMDELLKEIKILEDRIKQLETRTEQDCSNFRAEMYYPMAEAVTIGGTKRRMTLRGAVDMLMAKVFPKDVKIEVENPKLEIKRGY